MDNVVCQPGDEVLEECDHNSWGNTSCSHREDVGVVCRPSEYTVMVAISLATSSYCNDHLYITCLDPGDIKSAVQNLTVLSVNASSITVGWSVSFSLLL